MWRWLDRQDWLFGARVEYGGERDSMQAVYPHRKVSVDDLRNIVECMESIGPVHVSSGAEARAEIGDNMHARAGVDDLVRQSVVHQEIVQVTAQRERGAASGPNEGSCWLSVSFSGSCVRLHGQTDDVERALLEQVHRRVQQVVEPTSRMWPTADRWAVLDRVGRWLFFVVATVGFLWWVGGDDRPLAVVGVLVIYLLSRVGRWNGAVIRWAERHRPRSWLDLDPRDEVRRQRRNSKENLKTSLKTSLFTIPAGALIGYLVSAGLGGK